MQQIPIIAPVVSSPSRFSVNTIRFLHPGNYGSNNNAFLTLPCNDQASAPNTYGLHHCTALTACQIVANNAFTGFLAQDAEGKKRVDRDVKLDEVLTGGEYFFIVEGDTEYPIVPSFRDWEFPHDRLPDSWLRPPPTEGQPNDVCLITRYPWAMHKAHIVPSSEKDWFSMNNMSRYSESSVPDIDDARNIIPLKMDVHYCFDRFMFTIVPKPQAPTTDFDTESTKNALIYKLHVLAGDQASFTSLHHDIQLPHLRGIAAEYLFARFALSVLIRVKPFIIAGYRRRIARFMAVNNGRNAETVIEEVDGQSLQDLYGGGKSRNASLTKRKEPPEDTGELQEGEIRVDEAMPWNECVENSQCASIFSREQEVDNSMARDENAADAWYAEILDRERDRGRPTKRHKALNQFDGCSDERQFRHVTGDEDSDLPSLCDSGSSFNSDVISTKLHPGNGQLMRAQECGSDMT